MKKLTLILLAAALVSFTGCGNKSQEKFIKSSIENAERVDIEFSNGFWGLGATVKCYNVKMEETVPTNN